MLITKKINLPPFSEGNQVWQEFYTIFCKTLNPNLPFKVFKAYFFAQTPSGIDVSFVYVNNELVGFIEVSFYRNNFAGKKITIARGAAGILPNKGAKLPSFGLCAKYMKYKLQNPLEEIYITGYMANPILYTMMCNYTHRVYPKHGIKITPKIMELKKDILTANNLIKHLKDDYLVKLHFQVQLHEKYVQRIEASRHNKHMAYYLSINPNYGGNYGVFTIIPLDWLNILASLLKSVQYFILKVITNKTKMAKKYQPQQKIATA
jgi:hypothetical protein